MKIVLSRSEWGWCLPDAVNHEYYRRTGTTILEHAPRYDPILIDIIEQLREDSYWDYFEVVDVPDGYDFAIDTNYDGYETIRLHANEEYLRKLIASGDTEAIVKYVMRIR